MYNNKHNNVIYYYTNLTYITLCHITATIILLHYYNDYTTAHYYHITAPLSYSWTVRTMPSNISNQY